MATAEALYPRTLKALPGTRAVSVEWLRSRTRDAERTAIAALRHRAEARDRSEPVIGGVNPPAGRDRFAQRLGARRAPGRAANEGVDRGRPR